ncbi:TonB-dependent receptor [Sphingobium sp. BYY-5]|uniref:TonB-dependent receptor n=1 Tax=Sphingobium sp. BYY-5 TaxID=2926400 RepID=UPI001FA76A06|nr:TonB-dependent receptor [Sphingobium sp. BYY-5]MCI4590574.1 TonB-dependent receptor [Sphingobium sp. BYY-5]
MGKICSILLASTSLGAFPLDAAAQSRDGLAVADNDIIIVQARRRDEDVQDVPAVIDTVTAEKIAKLNFRDFKDVQTIVPGLQLSSDPSGVGGSAKLRGVNFDVTASGFNSTVEFYLNDAPIAAGVVLQQLFDVGQIEVQRGPQGTLRGRASPSGSIAVTTRKPDLYAIGGTIDMTANDIGTLNNKAALNLPIIEGLAAIRMAGIWDENEGDRVRPLDRSYGGRDPYSRTKAGRISGLLQPLDWLKLEGVYQRMKRSSIAYDQVASFSEVNADAPSSPIYIGTKDRLSILGVPRRNSQLYNIYNWRTEAILAGQVLIYQGQHNNQRVIGRTSADAAVIFPGRNVTQDTVSRSKSTSHEVRVQNEARLFDVMDYVFGFFDQRTNSPTRLTRRTPVRLPTALGGGLATLVETTIDRAGDSHEQSFFGNLTVHLGQSTEVSGGLRRIDYISHNALVIDGRTVANDGQDAGKWIYAASLKHNFTPDLMLYASTGSSWRPGINVVGDFNIAPSNLERSFLNLPAETSRSYEIGFKNIMLDGRLRLNMTAYHQKFDNYPYRAPNGVFYVNTLAARNAEGQVVGTRQEVATFNFVGAVPVTVNGLEGDVSFEASRRWTLGVTASYSLGKIKNGSIPCNDLDRDGVPDVVTSAPTLASLQAAVGADNLATCTVTQRSAFQSPFSATLQTEYRVPFSDRVDGYVRGLVAYNGRSQTDPTNIYDDVGAYALANLYAGIRDPQGRWEVSLFAKNLFETVKALSRTDPLSTSYQQLGLGGFQNGRPILTGPTSMTVTSTYTGVTTTPPREFGINVRYAFGGR